MQVAIPHGQLLSLQCLLLLDEQLLLLLVLSFLQASCKYGHLGEERVGGVHEDAGAGLLAQNLRLASGICLIPYALHILLLVAAYFGQHVLGQWQLQELEHALLCGKFPVQRLLANTVPVVLMLADALNQLLDVKICPLLVLLSIDVALASSSRAIALHQHVILGLDALWILSVRGIVSWLFSTRIQVSNHRLLDHLHLELVALEHALQAGSLEVVWPEDLWIVSKVKALLADEIRARQLLQGAVERVLLPKMSQRLVSAAIEGVSRQYLPVPNLVLAYITAEIADGRILRRYGLDFKGGD